MHERAGLLDGAQVASRTKCRVFSGKAAQSFAAPVFVTLTPPDGLPEAARPALLMGRARVLAQCFGGPCAKRQAVIARYRRHHAEVAALGRRVLG